MPWSREQLSRYLDRSKKPPPHVLLERGGKYMGRDVPDGYFMIQDWCVSQGIPIDSLTPDLTHVLQGVIYILQAGTSKHPGILMPDNLRRAMQYLNVENEFKDGALRQYPELLAMIKQELLKLPEGRKVIRILGEIPEYEDLFK